MSTKKTTKRESDKLFEKSMARWFKSMDLNRQICLSEIKHFEDDIALSKQKLAIHRVELAEILNRIKVAQKEFAEWGKQFK